jgi:hypothetical protein
MIPWCIVGVFPQERLPAIAVNGLVLDEVDSAYGWRSIHLKHIPKDVVTHSWPVSIDRTFFFESSLFSPLIRLRGVLEGERVLQPKR